jgi:hypothetical protein
MTEVGYHYTDANQLYSIEEKGLLPYPIDKPEFRPLFPKGVTGIWIWTTVHDWLDHAQCVLFHCARKKTDAVAVLRIRYDMKDVLKTSGMELNLAHAYGYEGMEVWDRTPVSIIVNPIPFSGIEVVDVVNLRGRVHTNG